jgi:hypothetical protein
MIHRCRHVRCWGGGLGQPPGWPDGDGKAAGSEFVTRFGLPTATALVVGSVIGTGVFALPSALAPYGPSSLVAFVLVTTVIAVRLPKSHAYMHLDTVLTMIDVDTFVRYPNLEPTAMRSSP